MFRLPFVDVPVAQLTQNLVLPLGVRPRKVLKVEPVGAPCPGVGRGGPVHLGRGGVVSIVVRYVSHRGVDPGPCLVGGLSEPPGRLLRVN